MSEGGWNLSKERGLLLIVLFLMSSCSVFRSSESQKVTRDKIEMLPAPQVLQKVNDHQKNYRTLKARANIQAQMPESSRSFSANLRMAKDSVIWMSVTGPLAREMIRLMITPDSVKLIDRTQSKVYLKDLGFIKNRFGLPLRFHDIQGLLTGQCVFCKGKTPHYKRDTFATDSQRQFLLHFSNKNFENRFWVNTTDFLGYKVELQHLVVNQTFEALYKGYEHQDSVAIPTENAYHISARKSFDIELDYNNLTINDSLNFPFQVPESYEKVF